MNSYPLRYSVALTTHDALSSAFLLAKAAFHSLFLLVNAAAAAYTHIYIYKKSYKIPGLHDINTI